ncbi:lysozyme inhibitor LprI family protein [Arcobacter sp. KX21116]|uniref:lysozyme inhibitor LprI family protein n=1 Tax=Arcobacter iocasae TaxID=2906515 RepID=UPI0035D40B57
MKLLILFILIFFSLNFCFAKDEIALVSKADKLYEIGKTTQAKKLYEQAAKQGDAQAHFALAYKYVLTKEQSIYHYTQAAIRGHEKALAYALDDLLFRANSLELANPKKALEVYNQAKKSNPKIKLYDEKNKLETMKLAIKSNDFDAKSFIEKYNIKDTNSSPYFIWELAQEASRNGRFGKANPKLVFDLVVRGGNVPAEYEEAVKATYKNWQNGITKFNLCEFITSGMGMGYCANKAEEKRKIKRENEIKQFKDTLTKANQIFLDDALKYTNEFIEKKAILEEGHGGSGRASFLINSESKQKNEYLKLLKKVKKGFVPKSKYSLEHYDKELNATYKNVLKKLKISSIEYTMSYPITFDNIKTVQRLWIKYRDANTKLFLALNPSSKNKDWDAYLSKQRTNQLKLILTY